MTNGTSAEAEIEIDFISDPANQSLHDLGDKIHGQRRRRGKLLQG